MKKLERGDKVKMHNGMTGRVKRHVEDVTPSVLVRLDQRVICREHKYCEARIVIVCVDAIVKVNRKRVRTHVNGRRVKNV